MGDNQGSVTTSEAERFPSAAATPGGLTTSQCHSYIQRSFRSPMVRFLMEKLEKSGCSIGNNFIKPSNCERLMNGGYSKGLGIIVCCNHMDMQDQVEQTIIHELIHAYDECRAGNLDWTNCAHHACSEIRAEHLSGNCHYKRELLRGFMKIRGHEQDCVRQRATESVIANPNCSELAAKEAIEAVWSTCYNDTQPFDRAP